MHDLRTRRRYFCYSPTKQTYFMKTLVLSMLLASILTAGSIYEFKVPGLDGKDIDLSAYKEENPDSKHGFQMRTHPAI